MTENTTEKTMTSSRKNYKLTKRDLSVVALLDDYRLLTTSQIQKLLYPSLQKAQTRLLALYQNELLKRFPYPVLLTDSGKGEYIYYTDQRKKTTLLSVQHLLKLNDIRIAFEKACQNSDKIKLAMFIPEYHGKLKADGNPGRKTETTVWDADRFGAEKTIIPDATIILENSLNNKKALFFLELDLGREKLITEKQNKYSLLKKMLLYKNYLNNKRYIEYIHKLKTPSYNFKGFRVLVVMNNPRRISRLKNELNKRGIKKFIWFTETQLISPETIFNKIWQLTDTTQDRQYSIITN